MYQSTTSFPSETNWGKDINRARVMPGDGVRKAEVSERRTGKKGAKGDNKEQDWGKVSRRNWSFSRNIQWLVIELLPIPLPAESRKGISMAGLLRLLLLLPLGSSSPLYGGSSSSHLCLVRRKRKARSEQPHCLCKTHSVVVSCPNAIRSRSLCVAKRCISVVKNVLTSIPTLESLRVRPGSLGGITVGKTLRDAQLRTRFNVTVMAIRQGGKSSPDEFPEPDHPLRMQDYLVLVGRPADVRRFAGEQGEYRREHFPDPPEADP
jgi:hypothetical protein